MMTMTRKCFAACSSQTNVSRLPSAQNHFGHEPHDDDDDDDDNGDVGGDGNDGDDDDHNNYDNNYDNNDNNNNRSGKTTDVHIARHFTPQRQLFPCLVH